MTWPQCSKCSKYHDDMLQCGTPPRPSEGEHSPLPWKAVDLDEVDWETEDVIRAPIHDATDDMIEGTRANYELIVKAVNNYAPMLELIKRLVRTSPDEIARGMASQLLATLEETK